MRYYLRQLAKFTSRLGDGWIWLFLSIHYLSSTIQFKHVGMVAILSILISLFLKGLIRLPRPEVRYDYERVKTFSVDVWGFPSSHVFVGSSVGISLFLLSGMDIKLGMVESVVIGAIGASRVILRRHDWIDVGLSVVLGMVVGICMWEIIYL